jgi:hypothetical protein
MSVFRGSHLANPSKLNRLYHFLFPINHQSRNSRLMCTSSNSPYEDFYRYTAGRWLWDEENQLRRRYNRFNVPELKRIAAASVNEQRCVSMIKLAEGGFNKVFRLVMENGSVVIARLPNPNNGPPYLTTASEVATMEFVSIEIHITDFSVARHLLTKRKRFDQP